MDQRLVLFSWIVSCLRHICIAYMHQVFVMPHIWMSHVTGQGLVWGFETQYEWVMWQGKALCEASKHSHKGIVDLLLHHNADVNFKDGNGQTALDLASNPDVKLVLKVTATSCGAVWCSVVQCDAVCCSVLQCVVECCSVLQCAAALSGTRVILVVWQQCARWWLA